MFFYQFFQPMCTLRAFNHELHFSEMKKYLVNYQDGSIYRAFIMYANHRNSPLLAFSDHSFSKNKKGFIKSKWKNRSWKAFLWHHKQEFIRKQILTRNHHQLSLSYSQGLSKHTGHLKAVPPQLSSTISSRPR